MWILPLDPDATGRSRAFLRSRTARIPLEDSGRGISSGAIELVELAREALPPTLMPVATALELPIAGLWLLNALGGSLGSGTTLFRKKLGPEEANAVPRSRYGVEADATLDWRWVVSLKAGADPLRCTVPLVRVVGIAGNGR